MTKKGTVTAVVLLLSALLGAAILGTDKNLWQYQPLHAYGLIAFVVVDLLLAGTAVMRGSKPALRVAGIWGLLQALVMVADVFTPSPFGTAYPISMSDFATYLFGLGQYDSNHIPYLFPALFVVNLLVLVVAMMEARGASRPSA